MDHNEEYSIYLVNYINSLGLSEGDGTTVVLIDGANLLFELNDLNELAVINISLNEALAKIHEYLLNELPHCKILIDIVLRNLYSFPISDLTTFPGSKRSKLILSYVRRPNLNEGISEESLLNQRRKVSEYDDAVLFRKLAFYSDYFGSRKVYLLSCDRYGNYKTFTRVTKAHSSGYRIKYPDFEVIEMTHSSMLVDTFHHYFNYRVNARMAPIYERLWRDLQEVNNNNLADYIYRGAKKLTDYKFEAKSYCNNRAVNFNQVQPCPYTR